MLARRGAIERVAWGWYYVPTRREPASVLEFLARDVNYNVVTGQTAASFWNGDFIHRETVSVAVDDPSYKRALEAFAEKRRWNVVVDYNPDARKIRQKRIRGLRVLDRETAIVDCMKRWAFVDAVATLSKEI
jgi:predicted transcriptional regulator of viral defense system